jgi:hypothetical protein
VRISRCDSKEDFCVFFAIIEEVQAVPIEAQLASEHK